MTRASHPSLGDLRPRSTSAKRPNTWLSKVMTHYLRSGASSFRNVAAAGIDSRIMSDGAKVLVSSRRLAGSTTPNTSGQQAGQWSPVLINGSGTSPAGESKPSSYTRGILVAFLECGIEQVEHHWLLAGVVLA